MCSLRFEEARCNGFFVGDGEQFAQPLLSYQVKPVLALHVHHLVDRLLDAAQFRLAQRRDKPAVERAQASARFFAVEDLDGGVVQNERHQLARAEAAGPADALQVEQLFVAQLHERAGRCLESRSGVSLLVWSVRFREQVRKCGQVPAGVVCADKARERARLRVVRAGDAADAGQIPGGLVDRDVAAGSQGGFDGASQPVAHDADQAQCLAVHVVCGAGVVGDRSPQHIIELQPSARMHDHRRCGQPSSADGCPDAFEGRIDCDRCARLVEVVAVHVDEQGVYLPRLRDGAASAAKAVVRDVAVGIVGKAYERQLGRTHGRLAPLSASCRGNRVAAVAIVAGQNAKKRLALAFATGAFACWLAREAFCVLGGFADTEAFRACGSAF
ncbi:hypothetical protein GMI70_01985 [Eggerthellaceae bacterium zg-893]|nr:hypothetical protein [Eggerthellaceae bacterium zg-893]